MGQKVNPILFRASNGQRSWDCDWYAKTKKEYEKGIFEDLVILKYLERCSVSQYIGGVKIERKSKIPHITIKTNKTVALLGKKGSVLGKIQKDLQDMLGEKVGIVVIDMKRPNLSARILATNIALQIRKRVSYKKAVKGAIESCMRAGALGIKIIVSGRLSGAEIARSETFKEGSMPLHTIRANIDFFIGESFTTYGVIGVKVWVYSGFGSVSN